MDRYFYHQIDVLSDCLLCLLSPDNYGKANQSAKDMRAFGQEASLFIKSRIKTSVRKITAKNLRRETHTHRASVSLM